MQSPEEIYEALCGILIDDFEIEADLLSMQANLYEDLDLDSIDAIDLVVKLKELTGKNIEPERFKQVRTIEDVVREVAKLLEL